MAGIYIHIPFCKRRCLYCDFYSTTLLERRADYIDAVIEEIKSRKEEAGEPLRTIYLGGGTPSTLEARDVERILTTIGTENAEEITMEINPGDVTEAYLQALRQAGIDRLSIGIQSFQNELLQLLGRRHNAAQAMEAVHTAQEVGFDNISIDLMYALPTQTMDQWKTDIETAIRLGVQHISSYGLIYEEGTAMTKLVEDGTLKAQDEETENAMYDYLCERLKEAGFEHYEVSNFALPGLESKHNSSYWVGTPYIGIGAAAHSYLPPVRSWNPSDLDTYIKGIMAHNLQRESETLSLVDTYNEYIMLGLRTSKGVNEAFTSRYRANFEPMSSQLREINNNLTRFLDKKLLRRTPDGRIVATQKGLHILNSIIKDLII